MQDPMLPMGVSDRDFDDDSEPIDNYSEEPIGFVTHDMATDACEREMEGMPIYAGSDRTDAELRGQPYPSNATEAASSEYEIAHWGE